MEYRCSVCNTEITKISKSGKCRICSQQKKPYRRIFTKLLYSAKKKNLKVELTYEEFLMFTGIPACHYCEESLIWVKYGKLGTRYNLDRIFPEEPYSVENCVAACWTCNEARGNRFSYVEFCKLKKGLKELQKVRKKMKIIDAT